MKTKDEITKVEKTYRYKYGYLVIRDDYSYDKEHFLFWNSKTNFSDIAEEELILFNPGFNTDIIDKIENILNEIENGKE